LHALFWLANMPFVQTAVSRDRVFAHATGTTYSLASSPVAEARVRVRALQGQASERRLLAVYGDLGCAEGSGGRGHCAYADVPGLRDADEDPGSDRELL
jgi:hypothetical protein